DGRETDGATRGGVRQLDSARVKQQSRGLRAAVKSVAGDRSTRVGELHARLVRTPRLELLLQHGPISDASEHSDAGDCRFVVPRRIRDDTHRSAVLSRDRAAQRGLLARTRPAGYAG